MNLFYRINIEKEKELFNADAFVLTSLGEAMPMSILEAWAYKLPVFMSEQYNLPDGFEYNAAIRVTPDPEDISKGLIRLFSFNDEDRINMGMNGYNLVRGKYEWDHIADMQIVLYKWLLNKGEKPDYVYLD